MPVYWYLPKAIYSIEYHVYSEEKKNKKCIQEKIKNMESIMNVA